jgi:hypothetical protein
MTAVLPIGGFGQLSFRAGRFGPQILAAALGAETRTSRSKRRVILLAIGS